jgi:uncharacterized cofD-like protein
MAQKFVALGGGNGTTVVTRSAQLTGLFDSYTAIISVTDSGRSTGVARSVGQIPAPGDIRNMIATFGSPEKQVLADLLQTRFTSKRYPSYNGMALGNLMLAGLTQVTGSFSEAVEVLKQLVDCPIHVLPVSDINTHICAELEDYTIVKTELDVRGTHKARIKRVFLQQKEAACTPAVKQALLDADVITIGPGSFYTSLIPTLLFKGVCESILESKAKVFYVANTTTQSGQTDDFSLADHLEYLFTLIPAGRFSGIICNNPDSVTPEQVEMLHNIGLAVIPVTETDKKYTTSLNVRLIQADITESQKSERALWNKQDTLKHSPEKLAELLKVFVEEQKTH